MVQFQITDNVNGCNLEIINSFPLSYHHSKRFVSSSILIQIVCYVYRNHKIHRTPSKKDDIEPCFAHTYFRSSSSRLVSSSATSSVNLARKFQNFKLLGNWSIYIFIKVHQIHLKHNVSIFVIASLN